MVSLEEQILQCLIVDGRASFRRIGEVVGASEQTVARRYRTMREAGQVYVTVRRSGYSPNQRAWWVRVRCRPDAAKPLAKTLADRHETSWVALVSGGSEVICRIVEPIGGNGGGVLEHVPRSTAVLSFSAHALLRPFAGGRDEWTIFDPPLNDKQISHLRTRVAPIASNAAVITDDDAPLLTYLAHDGRATTAALARSLGWPISRVSARLTALLGTNDLYVATDFLPETFGFHASALLQLTVAPSRIVDLGETLATHTETGFVAATTGTTNLIAAVTCKTFEDLFLYTTAKLGPLTGIQQMELVPYQQRIKQSTCHVTNGRLQPPNRTT